MVGRIQAMFLTYSRTVSGEWLIDRLLLKWNCDAVQSWLMPIS